MVDEPKMERGNWVLVRTMAAGVHFGKLVQHGSDSPNMVVLQDARRCWRWRSDDRKIFTLHELSLFGPGSKSQVSEPVDEITLMTAIEIIPMTGVAVGRLREAGWAV